MSEFQETLKEKESNGSVNQSDLDAAREAGNVWNYKGKELEVFVARGYIESATEIINPSTQEPTGAVLIHQFGWENAKPFIKRENAFKTSLSRVGRSTRQKVKTTQIVPVNADFYAELIQGGIIRRYEDGEPVDIQKSREEMLDFARLYPESASEAIESWLESGKCKLLDDNYGNDFNWVFTNLPVKKVLWYIGDEENPVAAAILTFNSPPKEKREKLDEDIQNIESERKGDQNFAELSENFARKVEFGLNYFHSVETMAFEREGNIFDTTGLSGRPLLEKKERLITLWNPIWFADAVDTMLEAFNFTKGKSKTN